MNSRIGGYFCYWCRYLTSFINNEVYKLYMSSWNIRIMLRLYTFSFFLTLVQIFCYRSDCFSCLFIWGHSSTSERRTWGDMSPLKPPFYLFIPSTTYLFLIPLMWCRHSLLILTFQYLYFCIIFPLSFFFCDLTFFMDLIPFTYNYSCCLFVFLHFLFGFLVLPHLRLGCLHSVILSSRVSCFCL